MSASVEPSEVYLAPYPGSMARSPRPSRVDEAVDALTDRIVGGELAAGEALPGQWELAEQMAVSRLTVREAITALAAKGMVEVQPGNGTFVRPPHEWTDLSALSRVRTRETGSSRVALSVIEIRRMIEVGAASLCAARRTSEDIDALRSALDAMVRARDAGDVATFVTHDLAFHHAVLRGCANPFLALVYDPLEKVLASAREQTSQVAAIRDHAVDHHRAILAAIESGDAEAAAAAMDAHMDQTADDLHTYVLGRPRD